MCWMFANFMNNVCLYIPTGGSCLLFFIMDALVTNPDFRLVFVDKDGSMSKVIPAGDSNIREHVMKEGYRCISHFWGKKRRQWKNHGVNGVDHKISIRPENAKRCLELFMRYKGYWWMDIFCIIQPDSGRSLDVGALKIMGDIYKNCEKCYSVLDKSMPIVEEDVTIANSLYGISESQNIFVWAMDICNINRNVYQSLFYVFSSNWANRIWTLQECVLPEKVCVVAEYPNSPEIPLEDIFAICSKLSSGAHEGFRSDIKDGPYSAETKKHFLRGVRLLENVTYISEEYLTAKNMRIAVRNGDSQSVAKIVRYLSTSRRESAKSADRVHGVSGLLGITVSGATLRTLRKSVVVSLWAKDVFITDRMRPDAFNATDDGSGDSAGLTEVYGYHVYGGIFVLSNAGTLRPKTLGKHSFGTIIRQITIGSGFGRIACPDKPHCGDDDCEKHRSNYGSFPDGFCTTCRNWYRKEFGIMVDISDESGYREVLMDDADVASLLSDDPEQVSIWSINCAVNAFVSREVYITKKYIIVLSKDRKLGIGKELDIPLYGEFCKLYTDDRENVGYRTATIVTIGKDNTMTTVGNIYGRR